MNDPRHAPQDAGGPGARFASFGEHAGLRLAEHTHAGHIYENPDEQLDVAAAFFRSNLDGRNRCVYAHNHPDEFSALDALARAGLAASDMTILTARDEDPAAWCEKLVQSSDIYVGIIGFRYGSPVRSRPDISYTELEFETATLRGLPRLVFLLDEGGTVPLPARQILDPKYGRRQAAFRRRLQQRAGLTVAFITTPDRLEIELFQALIELVAFRKVI